MKTALVFARMDSRRLPGKVLLDIGGKQMLERVCARVARASAVERVVVATSVRAVDDPIAAWASSRGQQVFRGDGADVAGRAAACCDQLGVGEFVRISGDSPFIDPAVIDGVCALYDRGKPDLATNVYPRSFPPGCSVEVVQCDALDRARQRMTSEDREHVTAIMYREVSRFRIANLDFHGDCATYRLTVDTPEELNRARWIVNNAGPDADALPLADVVALARRYRDVRRAAVS